MTYVDEERRHADLADLESALRDELTEIAAQTGRDEERRLKALEAELLELEDQGAREAEGRARQRACEKDIEGIRARGQEDVEAAQRAFDEFKSLHARKIVEDETLWREMAFRYEEYFEGGCLLYTSDAADE